MKKFFLILFLFFIQPIFSLSQKIDVKKSFFKRNTFKVCGFFGVVLAATYFCIFRKPESNISSAPIPNSLKDLWPFFRVILQKTRLDILKEMLNILKEKGNLSAKEAKLLIEKRKLSKEEKSLLQEEIKLSKKEIEILNIRFEKFKDNLILDLEKSSILINKFFSKFFKFKIERFCFYGDELFIFYLWKNIF